MCSESLKTVSIITATYNIIANDRKRSYLRLVDSIRDQSYSCIEHIIVDGASSDNTLELVEHCFDDSNLFGYKIISEPDDGIYSAYNKGIRNSSGSYIIFLNSDDYLTSKDSISSLVSVIEDNNNDFVFSQALTNNGRIIIPQVDSVLFKTPFCHQTMLTKRALFDDLNSFDESYKLAADYKFIAQALTANFNYQIISKPLVYFDGAGESAKLSETTQDEIIDIACGTVYKGVLTELEVRSLIKGAAPLMQLIKVCFSNKFNLEQKKYLMLNVFRRIARFRWLIAPIERKLRKK